MEPLAPVLGRLCDSSRRTFVNPYEAIDWPEELDREHWFTSPELISLFGTPAWDSLSDAERKRLSFWEAVNFYSLNIHGEKWLLEGLARRLYDRRLGTISEYLHHFLDEENKHSLWFGTFCLRYAGKVYPDRSVSFDRDYEDGEEDFLFFARVMMFEEVVDRHNVAMGRDERLHPLAREINARHHDDEVRHLIFGRRIVSALWETYRPRWGETTVDAIRAHLAGYLTSMWASYYRADVYRDAGLEDAWALRDDTWAHPSTRQHRRALSEKCTRFLKDNGILREEPEL